MELNEVLEKVAEEVSLLLAMEEQEELVEPVLSIIWEMFNKLEEYPNGPITAGDKKLMEMANKLEG